MVSIWFHISFSSMIISERMDTAVDLYIGGETARLVVVQHPWIVRHDHSRALQMLGGLAAIRRVCLLPCPMSPLRVCFSSYNQGPVPKASFRFGFGFVFKAVSSRSHKPWQHVHHFA